MGRNDASLNELKKEYPSVDWFTIEYRINGFKEVPLKDFPECCFSCKYYIKDGGIEVCNNVKNLEKKGEKLDRYCQAKVKMDGKCPLYVRYQE